MLGPMGLLCIIGVEQGQVRAAISTITITSNRKKQHFLTYASGFLHSGFLHVGILNRQFA